MVFNTVSHPSRDLRGLLTCVHWQIAGEGPPATLASGDRRNFWSQCPSNCLLKTGTERVTWILHDSTPHELKIELSVRSLEKTKGMRSCRWMLPSMLLFFNLSTNTVFIEVYEAVLLYTFYILFYSPQSDWCAVPATFLGRGVLAFLDGLRYGCKTSSFDVVDVEQ